MASSGEVPQNALPGGFDSERNQNLYIARAKHDGYIFPGKLVPQDGHAYISCDGVEIQKCDYEVKTLLYIIYFQKIVLLIDLIQVLCKFNSLVKNTAIEMNDESDLDVTNYLGITHL